MVPKAEPLFHLFNPKNATAPNKIKGAAALVGQKLGIFQGNFSGKV
jgi:hypothetical protein